MKIFIQQFKDGLYEIDEDLSPDNLDLPGDAKYLENVRLHIDLNRFEDAVRLKINVKTKVERQCDRCLTGFISDFNEHTEQIYQLGAGDLSDDDEVVLLPADAREIDISKLIHDIFLEQRPIALLCKETCKGLCPSCGIDLNNSQCDCHIEFTDPRWAKLKEIFK